MATVPGTEKVQALPAGSNPLAALLPLLTDQQTKIAGGVGDVAALQQLLQILMPTTTVAGMNPVIQEIFRAGFQNQMPAIYNASNQAGLRPGSSTQQALLVNDLNARLAAEAAKAVNQQQQTAGQVATAIAQNSKSPEVTTQKQSINTGNAAAAAAILAGAKLLQGVLGSGADTAVPTSDKKKQAGGDVMDAAKVLNSVFGQPFDWGTSWGAPTVSLPGASTGGINANPLSFMGDTGGSSFGGFGDPATAFISNMIGGNDFSTSASTAAAYSIPGAGPVIAAADTIGKTLGINELTDITSGITNTIGDIGSAIVEPFGCYITTAVCELDGKPDDCEELQSLRNFRDNWLKQQPGGEALVKEYYEQAPRFLAVLNKSKYREQILRDFQFKFINPAVHAANNGMNETAFTLYVDMLREANDYIRHMEG